MAFDHETCWTLVRGAIDGDEGARDRFVRVYDPVIRAYFRARWQGRQRHLTQLDDAVQEVFLDCFGPSSALTRLDEARAPGFRGYLRGICRIVALRIERSSGRTRERQVGDEQDLDHHADDEESLSKVFDRAWAKMILAEALADYEATARSVGGRMWERALAFRKRVYEGRSIAEIARRTGRDAATLSSDVYRARDEFRASLGRALSFHDAKRGAASDDDLRRLLNAVRGG